MRESVSKVCDASAIDAHAVVALHRLPVALSFLTPNPSNHSPG